MRYFTFSQLLLLTMFFLMTEGILRAQHLNYPDKKNGDIIMNEVMITNTTGCSYWETMGWNVGGQGGAYCGIQQSGNGSNFIFSIWDPIGTTTPITAPYHLPNTQVVKFGGEGTGLHYDDQSTIGWKLNTWVRTVSRRWDYNGHSFFGFWSYDYGTTTWAHHITMDFPVASVQFNSGGSNSFLEDFCSTPQNYRKGLYKNGYKRASGTWIPWKTGSYYGNGGSSTDNKANAGIENGAYFMEYGGSTVKTVKEGQALTLTLPALPVLTVGQIASATASVKTDSVSVSWVTDKSKSPQFSYTVKLINAAGTVALSKTDIVPHLRRTALYIKNLAAGVYTVRVSMLDIFDQMSNEIDHTVTVGNPNGINDLAINTVKDITVHPNPCNQVANFFFNTNDTQEAIINMYDVTGRSVIRNARITVDQPSLDVSTLQNGLYFIEVGSGDKNIIQHIKLIKE